MSEAFDPYYKWLGIPADEQPANYYRMLGLRLFEHDRDVIESAADRQMAHVRTFQAGPYSALSQMLLNELSAVRLCLLTPDHKAAYDAALRRQIDAASSVPGVAWIQPAPISKVELTSPDQAAPPLFVADQAPALLAAGNARLSRGRADGWPAAAAIAILAATLVVYLIWAKPIDKPAANLIKPLPASESAKESPAPKRLRPEPVGLEPKSPELESVKPAAPELVAPPAPAIRPEGIEPQMAPTEAAVEVEDEGFVPLFNGKDLAGWKTHPSQPGNWRVENGVLIASGRSHGDLYSEKETYTDFHLRVEARINEAGNSGVFCRSQFGPIRPPNNPRWPDGYEAQINVGHVDKNKTGSLYGPHGVAVTVADSPVPANDWFTLEFIAVNNRLVVKVNGKTTADYVDVERRFATGRFALQQHNPETVIEFRKIEVREIVGQREHPPLDQRFPASKAASSPSAVTPDESPKARSETGRPPIHGRSLADLANDNYASPPARLAAMEAFALKQHTGAVTKVAFHPSLPLLASGGKDGRVLLWNLDTRAAVQFDTFNEEIWTVKFSPDGGVMSYANRNRWGSVVPFKEVATGKQLKRLKDFKSGGAVASIAYSPDGNFFASGQDDGSVRLWETGGFQEILPLSVGRNAWSLAFGPIRYVKGKPTQYLLAVGCGDGSIKLLELSFLKDKNGPRWTFAPNSVTFPRQEPVHCVRFSPDGKLLASTRARGLISFFSPENATRLHKDIHVSNSNTDWLSFHPQRPWVVTAHFHDRRARIWNYETGEMLCELSGHTGGVLCAEFSRDGRRVATTSDDFSIKVWDLSGSDLPEAAKRGKKTKPAMLKVGD